VNRSGGHRRLQLSLAVSALVHVAGLALVMWMTPPLSRGALAIIPVTLVGMVGGGGGDAGGPAPGPAAAVETPEPPARPEPHARPRPAPPRRSTPPTPSPNQAAGVADEPGTASADAGGLGTGSGSGGGNGSGGDGTGGSQAAYGTNPEPGYPLLARRLGQEGVVLLEVVVAPDGRAREVRVVRSSGYPVLDESALSTVRERWRFVPAVRGGTAVESRVTVPIRFRLTSAATQG
jgi:protein TonB